MTTSSVDRSVARGVGGSLPGALLATARPRQWLKNVLVFAGPGAAGALSEARVAVSAGVAFIAFTLAAAGTYFFNDAMDVEADRRHPRKRMRPVAAGRIGVRQARGIGALLAAAALLLAIPLGWPFLVCVAGYLTLTTAYSATLKSIAVLDVLVVAAGFLLRTVAGEAATKVPTSSWFLLLTLLGSLFLVTAKRFAEHNRTQTDRRALADYSTPWLQQTLTMTMTGTVIAYAAWAFQSHRDTALPLLAASIVPLLAALMRYSLLVARGAGETPEDLLTSDPFLLVAGLAWLAAAGGALYLA